MLPAMTVAHRLAISVRGADPRAIALQSDAHAMGFPAITGVTVTDLVFVRGDVAIDARAAMTDLLVDPLLQASTWDEVTTRPAAATSPDGPGFSVESVLLPGVTDAVATQLLRLSRRSSWPVTAVATGRRVELHGHVPPDLRDLLVRRLLVNPVIERWAIDGAVHPEFTDPVSDDRRASPASPVLLPVATDADLDALNRLRGLALDPDELRAIREYYAGRGGVAPDIELEMIAQTWSEHCAHKTFRARITTTDGIEVAPLLDQLRQATATVAAPFVTSAFVGNAGVVSFVPGTTLAVKCETHNHPSAIEPFGGANTGVGGVIRDVLGAAHRPIACTDILCFGPSDTPVSDLPEGAMHPRRIRAGVIAGIADYGNKVGLPTVAGAVLHDPGYVANPLVFAGCIGVARAPYVVEAPVPGARIVVVGGATGRDGIRGATFSSATMDATTGDVAGASVQIGDPITGKLLIDLLADNRHLYRSITDCGAGGLSSAIGEMAEGVGATVDLDDLPMKYPGLAPWEVWLSEAQERMVVATPDPAAVREACDRLGIHCTDVGTFTGTGRLVVRSAGQALVDIDTAFLHHGRPQRRMVARMPLPLQSGRRDAEGSAPGTAGGTPTVGGDPAAILLDLLAHPNIACKASVIRRYDHEVRGATVVRPLVGEPVDGRAWGHADGTVLAEPTDTHGIAIGIGVNPRYGVVDPERMGEAVVDEAMRNVVACGGDPSRTALLDNFSWGDPRREETLGALVATVRGACRAAIAHGAPFVSGKDSLNNEHVGPDGRRHAIPPTLVITAVAHVADASRTVTPDLKAAGNALVVIGGARVALGGSHLGLVRSIAPDVAPSFDPDAPHRYRRLHACIRDGLVVACHDISEGGLAVALAEMAIAGNLGIDAPTLPGTVEDGSGSTTDDDLVALFGEANGRFVIEVEPAHLAEVASRFPDDATVIGTVADDGWYRVGGAVPSGVASCVRLPVTALREAWGGRP